LSLDGVGVDFAGAIIRFEGKPQHGVQCFDFFHAADIAHRHTPSATDDKNVITVLNHIHNFGQGLSISYNHAYLFSYSKLLDRWSSNYYSGIGVFDMATS
jgi:hypothetical protein